ncbi:hypothetical protein SALBM311S_09880 [Streptomyces alboniger]
MPAGTVCQTMASRFTSSSTLGSVYSGGSRPARVRVARPCRDAPEHLGEQSRVDAVPGDLAEAFQQRGESVLERFRGVLLCVRETAVELEDGVVDRRVV